MSDVLELAATLRNLDDSQIAALCRQCLVGSTGIKDFFDLAEALLQNKSVEAWLATQSRNRLTRLISDDAEVNVNDGTGEDAMFGILQKRFSSDDALAKKVRATLASSHTLSAENDASPIDKRSIHDAGIRAFLTTQALTEFVLDLENRYLREVGKLGLALPDVKRLGQHLGLGLDQVRELWDLARLNDLCKTKQSRWLRADAAIVWLESDVKSRWRMAAARWAEMLSKRSRTEVTLACREGQTLRDLLVDLYPLADLSSGSKLDRLCRHAEALGLTDQGLPQPWLKPVLLGELSEASTAVSRFFPETQPAIVLQGDLSVVTPGPLDQKREKRLREFVQAESVGLASHYRLTALSVSHALEHGHSIEEIEATLVEFSKTPLPQPVKYLLGDVSRRFGKIKVIADLASGGSHVRVTEPALALELANDIRHRIIALRQIDATTLFSKYPAEVVYFTLRDFGQVAVLADLTGEVQSPTPSGKSKESSETNDPVLAMVARLRTNENQEQDTDGLLLRQLQLAIKNKSVIKVSYLGREGSTHEFVLEPVALSNGRLRARDRKADIERTLPIANITGLHLA